MTGPGPAPPTGPRRRPAEGARAAGRRRFVEPQGRPEQGRAAPGSAEAGLAGSLQLLRIRDPEMARTFDEKRFGGPIGELIAVDPGARPRQHDRPHPRA
jgi:hypothetical protein